MARREIRNRRRASPAPLLVWVGCRAAADCAAASRACLRRRSASRRLPSPAIQPPPPPPFRRLRRFSPSTLPTCCTAAARAGACGVGPRGGVAGVERLPVRHKHRRALVPATCVAPRSVYQPWAAHAHTAPAQRPAPHGQAGATGDKAGRAAGQRPGRGVACGRCACRRPSRHSPAAARVADSVPARGRVGGVRALATGGSRGRRVADARLGARITKHILGCAGTYRPAPAPTRNGDSDRGTGARWAAGDSRVAGVDEGLRAVCRRRQVRRRPLVLRRRGARQGAMRGEGGAGEGVLRRAPPAACIRPAATLSRAPPYRLDRAPPAIPPCASAARRLGGARRLAGAGKDRS